MIGVGARLLQLLQGGELRRGRAAQAVVMENLISWGRLPPYMPHSMKTGKRMYATGENGRSPRFNRRMKFLDAVEYRHG